MIGIKNKKRKGFTLIEVTVSVALFAVIMVSTTRIFQMVLDGQRQALASQNVQESLKYFFEVMSKETRMAQKNDLSCFSYTEEKLYYLNADKNQLSFQNYNGDCVRYSLEEVNGISRFKIQRDSRSGYITPKNIEITNLDFRVNEGTDIQTMLTINLTAEALGKDMNKAKLDLQTSITSRYYE